MSSLDSFWQEKHVIVTGASSGIGAALARQVAQRGARVGLIARREAVLASRAGELSRESKLAAHAVADVCDRGAVAEAVRSLEASLGPCDVAIACAGLYRKTSGGEFSAEAANAVVATNLQGTINLFAAVLPAMVDRRAGNLAAVASVGALLGLPAAAAYCASKTAVVRLMQSLRVDLYAYGVKVTTICPGFVDTPMITDEERRTLKHLVAAPDAARRIAWAIASGRAEYWFPWQTWFQARLLSFLPAGLYRRAMTLVGEMEET